MKSLFKKVPSGYLKLIVILIVMKSDELTKYKTAIKIAKAGYTFARDKILSGERDISRVCKDTDQFVLEELSRVYKRESSKHIGFPCCISPNGIAGYNTQGTLGDDDVVKIEVGVEIGGTVGIYGDTFLLGAIDAHAPFLEMLENIQKVIAKDIREGDFDTITLKTAIESLCTEYNCFPIENCISYQHFPGHIRTEESKYIVLNHTKYYDDEDALVVEPNVCFEICDGEVYHVDVTIVPTGDTEPRFKFSPAQILRFNDTYYSLKLRNSKQTAQFIKSKHSTNAFAVADYNTPGHKLGIRECIDKGIVDEFPVETLVDNRCVYFKKFTMILHNGKVLFT